MPGEPGMPDQPCARALEHYLTEVTARLPGPAKAWPSCAPACLMPRTATSQPGCRPSRPSRRKSVSSVTRDRSPTGPCPRSPPATRRMAMVLLVTGLLAGLLWLGAATASHLAIRIAAEHPPANPLVTSAPAAGYVRDIPSRAHAHWAAPVTHPPHLPRSLPATLSLHRGGRPAAPSAWGAAMSLVPRCSHIVRRL